MAGKKQITLKSSAHMRRIRSAVKAQAEAGIELSELIGDLAEPPMAEYASADALATFLSERGFAVSRPWKDIPTAFRATAGKGRPTVALLAEYDALPDCGPRPGAFGHGCGHNLLGVAAAMGGIAAAEVLRKLGKEGTIVVFGTPAEETLSGKVRMADHGAFRGLDAVLAWHPSNQTRTEPFGGAAMDSVHFQFFGKTAHAAGAPHEGRSALDAALLTDVGVNYLREHVKSNVRIHSVIPDGGKAPNVVPDRAEIWYYIRGVDRKQVDDLRRRVQLCARGAALATETRCRMTVTDSVTERIPNWPLTDMMDALLKRLGAPKFTPSDLRTAKRIASHVTKYDNTISKMQEAPGLASSDEDNVSWFAPLGKISVACVPVGTIGHHRQYAQMVRTHASKKGMLLAADILATAAVELTLNAPLVRKAREDFKKNKKGRKYQLPKRGTLRRKPS